MLSEKIDERIRISREKICAVKEKMGHSFTAHITKKNAKKVLKNSSNLWRFGSFIFCDKSNFIATLCLYVHTEAYKRLII